MKGMLAVKLYARVHESRRLVNDAIIADADNDTLFALEAPMIVTQSRAKLLMSTRP